MIDTKIKLLGSNFRGLWQTREPTAKTRRAIRLNKDFREYTTKWYVTFRYNGDFVETEAQSTIEEALNYAIDCLNIQQL